MSIPNTSLRDYVQRSAFDLQLGRSHIAALIWLDLGIRNRAARVQTPKGTHGHSIWSLWAPAAGGLARRGLIVHHYRAPRIVNGKTIRYDYIGHHYTITTAGKLVLGLLKEAGLYDEYAAQLLVVVDKTA